MLEKKSLNKFLKKDKQITTIIFGVIGLLLLSAIIYNQIKTSNLKKSGIILNARITKIALVTKGSPMYGYEFNFRGKYFYRENSTGVKKLNFFIGKYFPVIFSPKSKNSELLISPEDFEKFDIPFPDSLKWVLQYRNN